MSADSVTLGGRRLLEAMMTSTCVIKRLTGTAPDGQGVDQPTYSTIYSGKCRLRMPNANSGASEVGAGGQSLALQRPMLSIPVEASGSDAVRADDIATVTSPLDPEVVVARVAGIHSQTHSTARRFPVEVTS